MKCKVLLCFCVLSLINHIFPTEISVHLSTTVTLPCSFHLSNNDELLNITWSFNGSIIASNNQTESERYLITSPSGFNGNYLTLFNVTPHSQGLYECHVKSNLTNYFNNVTLIILVPPSVSVPFPEVVLGRESTIECLAKGFSPPSITFSWTRAGQNIRTPQKFKINQTEDGLYESLSELVLIPELNDRNITYACVVTHETLEKPLVREFRINITILPKVTLSVVPSTLRSSPLTLVCEINGFYPQNMSVSWIRNGTVLPETSKIQKNNDGTYRMRRFLTLGMEEREKAGQVQCVAQQRHITQPALGSIDLSTADSLVQKLVLTKSAKASVAMMIISLVLVLLLCFGFSWKRRDEKQKSLSVSCIILPPKVVVGQKGRVTISIEGRRADQVQTAWFLNDIPIIDTSHKDSNSSRGHTPRTSRVSLLSEKAPLLASTGLGYYKLHTRKPLHSMGPTKQLLSSFTFIPTLSVHKGAAFKCQISYKGKDKIVMERVSEKFTVMSPPLVSEIQLSEPNEDTGIVIMTVEASHFHPDVITFRWFCEGGELCPVAAPSALSAPRPDAQGFFSARSQCRLHRTELERGETAVWVTVHHISLKQPITRKTRGFIKKPTVSEITCALYPSSPQPGLLTLTCSITNFYPPDIAVKWLKRCNSMELEVKKEEGLIEVWGPVQTQLRTFRAMAFLNEVENSLKEAEKNEMFVCRVEHCSLLEPIERVWTNSHIVAPSIPASLSISWNNDGVGVFSLSLSGGVPPPKLQWAAGGSILMPLISRETEKVTDQARELQSVCALTKSGAPQGGEVNFQNIQNGHLCNSQFPVLPSEAHNEMPDKRIRQEKQSERAEVTPDFIDETTKESGQPEFDSLHINTVYVGKEGRPVEGGCLRVTVEITHPALHLPVYFTWTEPEVEVESL